MQPNNTKSSNEKPVGDRIAKVIARAGICSRREAERKIEQGDVSVNGKQIKTPATFVTDADRIVVDGRAISRGTETQLWRYHKQAGFITSHNDEKDRPTVFQDIHQKLSKDIKHIISVGRLDYNTEGLLLLTNDGALSRHLEHPSTGWKRRYRVRAHGRYNLQELEKLIDGITIDGIKYGSIEITLDKEQGHNTWFNVGLLEGKNREIRKVFEHFDLQVNRLIRMSYGPFQLGNMPKGHIEEVTGKVLKEQLSQYFKDSQK